jgi:large subunit ribosomal protein L10
MVKAESVATVAEIADQFRTSQAAVITEYRGLTMKQITNLRKALGADTQYTVAKNTLVKRAAADAGVEGLDDLFTGPTAIAFVKGEPSDAAKAIREFARTNPLLVVKGGLLDGKLLAVADVSKIADLESREVLLAKFAGAMKGNLAKAAYAFAALPSQMARLAAALQEKLAEGAPAEEAAAPAEAPDAAVAGSADAAPAESTSDDGVVNAEANQAETASTEAPVEAPVAVEDAAPAAAEAEAPAAADVPDAVDDARPDGATSDDGSVNTEVNQAEAASTEPPVEAGLAAEEPAPAEAGGVEESPVAETAADEATPASDASDASGAPDAPAAEGTSDDGVANAEANQAEAASTEAPADQA